MNNLTTAIKDHLNSRQQGELLSQKRATAAADVNLLRKQRDEAGVNLVTLEKNTFLTKLPTRN